ncbi:TldD/PmbA family protein [uncultured Thiodictyon sp.]|uniref:TldD/PmbA family protein n=3 Tax=uncultured Thiodictyon sp. TaxID=1846217 RepID=UPI0025FAE4E2|nr:TldD/PmbA family protein [uncultured Thiodictyon sp.]
MNRRQFLATGSAGLASVALPRFLGAAPNATDLTQPAPANPFLEWFGIDEALIRRVMSELTANGAAIAELYFQHKRTNLIRMQDGLASQASSDIAQGVGLRVVVAGQTGYAFTEDLTPESMLRAARVAATIANGARAPVPVHFDPRRQGDLYPVERPWSEVGLDEKLPLIQKVEALVRAADPAIDKVTVQLTDTDERVLIATLDGHLLVDRRPSVLLGLMVTAKRGAKTQSNLGSLGARDGLSFYTDGRLKAQVDEVVARTLVLFDAKRPPAGEMPVMLAAGASSVLLHEAIGHGMEADFNRIGTSIYSDMIGKPVAAPFVNVVDQGNLPHELGTLNMDDEGNATGRAALVEKGILKSYLHDNLSARHYGIDRDGVAHVGSGRRESYRFPILPRMTTTFMENGPHTREEIVAAIDRGIVAETFTGGQVAIGPGDFTFYVKNGWLVEGGKITAPIKDVNLIGNGPEALKRITMVANDFKLDPGGWICGKYSQSVPVSIGMPSALVSRMTVGGENV